MAKPNVYQRVQALMDKNGSMTVAQACEKLGVSTSGYYSQASKARHAGKAKRLKAGKAKRASKGKVESVSYASSELGNGRGFPPPLKSWRSSARPLRSGAL